MEFTFLYWLLSLHRPWLDQVMVMITFLGEAGWFWIATGVLLLCSRKTRACGLALLISLAAGAVIGNGILKPLFHRQRPCWIDPKVILLVSNPTDFSFPSGHTLAGFEAAVSIFFSNRKWGLAALILACLLGFSRLYLFVHFPTDVLAGMLLGTGIAVAVHFFIYEKIHPMNEEA